MENESCCPCRGGVLHWIAKILVIVGALNWGLIGFFEYNLVNALLGSWPVVERVVYDVVGVAAVFMLVMMFWPCKKKEMTA